MRPELIAATARRAARVECATALATGIIAGAIVAPVSMPAALVLFLVVSVVVWRRSAHRRGTRAAAAAIERVRPSANVVITAEELSRHPERAASWIVDRIAAEADRATDGLRPRDIVSRRRAGVLAGVAAVALGVAAAMVAAGIRGGDVARTVVESVSRISAGVSGASIAVIVEPPSYSGRPGSRLENPSRIEALEGSRIRFDLPAEGSWRVRFGQAAVTGAFVASVNGYFAVEEEGADSRLIPLTVQRDSAPIVRIGAPAKDLLLPDGTRTIPVEVIATDDLALRAVELRYTKVSGSGEQFEFQEGSLPLRVERTSPGEWRGAGRLALPQLRLASGDSLVYRAVARDARPGDSGLGTSDTYFIEIAGPGQVALAGVEMPADMERYALSQQMVVQKIERLRARETSLADAARGEEFANLAAEQRAVRANFVFLMGGHVEDEEVEAEQSHEIQEGRLENTARREIDAAIGHMTRAEQGLVAMNTAAALPPARQAVEALQRAFGRSRYLLRSLAVRSRLDPARRLTGDITGARDWQRGRGEPVARAGQQARDLLARLMNVESDGPGRSVELKALAEQALAIDPGSPLWQEVAARLVAGEVRIAIAKVAPEARQGMLPRTAVAEPGTALSRAWRSERQR